MKITYTLTLFLILFLAGLSVAGYKTYREKMYPSAKRVLRITGDDENPDPRCMGHGEYFTNLMEKFPMVPRCILSQK